MHFAKCPIALLGLTVSNLMSYEFGSVFCVNRHFFLLSSSECLWSHVNFAHIINGNIFNEIFWNRNIKLSVYGLDFSDSSPLTITSSLVKSLTKKILDFKIYRDASYLVLPKGLTLNTLIKIDQSINSIQFFKTPIINQEFINKFGNVALAKTRHICISHDNVEGFDQEKIKQDSSNIFVSSANTLLNGTESFLKSLTERSIKVKTITSEYGCGLSEKFEIGYDIETLLTAASDECDNNEEWINWIEKRSFGIHRSDKRKLSGTRVVFELQ